MAHPASTRKQLLKTEAELTATLQKNNWPLGADQRPFTWFGDGEWTNLSKEQAQADPDRAQSIERQRADELACRRWRGRIDDFLIDSRRFVNDYGSPEHRQRFENNILVAFAASGDDLSRERYRTSWCLRDLESLKILLKRIGRGNGRSRPTRRKKSRLASELYNARRARGQKQKEAAHEMGMTQSVYSLYETGTRKPEGENLVECRKYINKTPEVRVPEADDKRNKRH
jgi:hypothetical protein